MGTETGREALASTDTAIAGDRPEGTGAADRKHTAAGTVAGPAQCFQAKGRAAAAPFTPQRWGDTAGCKRDS